MTTILASSTAGITRMLPYDAVGGLTLEDWTPSGLHEVTLPPDAVLALLRQLPREVLEEALEEVTHWRLAPGLSVCGSERPTLRLTMDPKVSTCPACLEAWQSACQAIPVGHDTLNAERG